VFVGLNYSNYRTLVLKTNVVASSETMSMYWSLRF